mmetsp:Transcript_41947/g.101092  ORF Transcript_41947/g.101092 Transcript_41947/m.101092 type:complete len:91 (-) Transcript_41947:1263-1535(-)
MCSFVLSDRSKLLSPLSKKKECETDLHASNDTVPSPLMRSIATWHLSSGFALFIAAEDIARETAGLQDRDSQPRLCFGTLTDEEFTTEQG